MAADRTRLPTIAHNDSRTGGHHENHAPATHPHVSEVYSIVISNIAASVRTGQKPS